MKTFLVDAWNTFVKEEGVDHKLKALLDRYSNPKIIVTNANKDEKEKFGIVDMPYPVFSLSHNPNKTDSNYFKQLLVCYKLNSENIIYFEHNEDAVKSAQLIGIKTLWFKKNENLNTLKVFLDNNI